MLFVVKCLELLVSFLHQESVSIRILWKLYITHPSPLTIYYNHVWSNAYMSTLNSLVPLQKIMVRIITGSKHGPHTDALLNGTGLLELQDIKYVMRQLMFRLYHNEERCTFQEFDVVKVLMIRIWDKKTSLYSHSQEWMRQEHNDLYRFNNLETHLKGINQFHSVPLLLKLFLKDPKTMYQNISLVKFSLATMLQILAISFLSYVYSLCYDVILLW